MMVRQPNRPEQFLLHYQCDHCFPTCWGQKPEPRRPPPFRRMFVCLFTPSANGPLEWSGKDPAPPHWTEALSLRIRSALGFGPSSNVGRCWRGSKGARPPMTSRTRSSLPRLWQARRSRRVRGQARSQRASGTSPNISSALGRRGGCGPSPPTGREMEGRRCPQDESPRDGNPAREVPSPGSHRTHPSSFAIAFRQGRSSPATRLYRRQPDTLL
jgi:hypothetical protein